jgi:AcrR family transcriptional regulator
MARTQALDYDKRLKTITSTAARLYAERGFLGTSVAQLAAACRISKSLLYHYYPSKEDILFDVMDSHVQSLVRSANGLVQTPASAANTVRRLAEELMNLYVDAQDHQKVLLNELVNLPASRRKLIVEHQRQLLDIVDQLVLRLRPDLSKRRSERRAIGMLFFGMLNWTHTWFNPRGPVKHSEFAHMISDTFLAGIKAYVV